ncbi:carbon storage regulator CsrA [Paenibacillus guangzhouensis]|uniref:carbon storage regulator CsrA n=1 Tax=Paenibacillus guangzhouensis TaxID=1473112 RepID=UPI001267736B|nr:carbon storage regulator CsrA [Paenibacillus guangzhouensis]
MLILTRKKGQSIIINDEIEIIISAVDGDQVKVGINAPKHMKIYRKEVVEAIEQSNKEAISSAVTVDLLKNLIKSE